MSNTVLLPFQPEAMSPAQLAAVSYLARYSGHTHTLYAYHLRRWFGWCQTNSLDSLVGIQRAHVELYIRHLGESGPRPSSVNTSMHAVRGFFRFAHIDGLIPSDPAVYARLPKIHSDESRTQGLDRLELIGFLQVAQTITVHHGDLAYLLGINAVRASEAAVVRIEDYQENCAATGSCTWSAKGTSPPPCLRDADIVAVATAPAGVTWRRSEAALSVRPDRRKDLNRWRRVLRSGRCQLRKGQTCGDDPRMAAVK
jgi:integrase/recombinase XerD